MELRDYLHTERIHCTDFAKKLDVSRNHLNQIKNRKLKPGKSLAKLIAAVTDGKVSLNELLRDPQ